MSTNNKDCAYGPYRSLFSPLLKSHSPLQISSTALLFCNLKQHAFDYLISHHSVYNELKLKTNYHTPLFCSKTCLDSNDL